MKSALPPNFRLLPQRDPPEYMEWVQPDGFTRRRLLLEFVEITVKQGIWKRPPLRGLMTDSEDVPYVCEHRQCKAVVGLRGPVVFDNKEAFTAHNKALHDRRYRCPHDECQGMSWANRKSRKSHREKAHPTVHV